MTSAIPSDVNLSDSPTTTELASVVETLVAQQAEAQQERERLRQEVDRLRDENDELRDENDELRDELESVRDRAGRDRAELSSRVTELEESQDGSEETDSPGSNPRGSVSETTTQAPETPLGQAIRLPTHVAEENLTKNQQRARSVAKDIHEYATSVPAGYRLSASEMRRVLSAQEDGATIHGQTLARVRDFMLRLCSEHVELRESRDGSTSIIFDSEFVKRVVAWSNHDDGHGAVSRGGVSG